MGARETHCGELEREKQKVSAAKRRARAPSEIRPGAGRRQGRSLDWARQGRAPWHSRDPSRGRTWAAVGRADRERCEQRNARTADTPPERTPARKKGREHVEGARRGQCSTRRTSREPARLGTAGRRRRALVSFCELD
jgi:hypothetical protein